MESYQMRFVRLLKKIMVESGYELVVQESFTNTGTIDIVAEDSFEPILTFSYKFQTGHNVFESDGPVWPPTELSPGTNRRMYIAKNLETLGECLNQIYAYVEEAEAV